MIQYHMIFVILPTPNAAFKNPVTLSVLRTFRLMSRQIKHFKNETFGTHQLFMTTSKNQVLSLITGELNRKESPYSTPFHCVVHKFYQTELKNVA